MEAKTLLVAATLAVISIIFSVLHVVLDTAGSPGDTARRVELIPLSGAAGPESFAFDPDGGGPYTGVSDGRILKWEGRQHGWRDFASVSPPHLKEECRGSHGPATEHVCGRPLGLRFHDRTGELYVADAYRGLLTVGATAAGDKNSTRLVASQARGVPFRFTNGVDVDQDTGVVYFSESSTRFQRREFMMAIVSGDRTGRVMRYDPRTDGEPQVLLDGLSFPNGVALSGDNSYLLVVETTPCRVLRYWLRTRRAGEWEVLADLPGFPDNIRRSPRGGFWVALHSKRGKFLRWFLMPPIPWVRELLRRAAPLLDLEWWSRPILRWTAVGPAALRLTEEGEVLEVLHGVGADGGGDGGPLRFVSEVVEKDGTLWVGSVVMPHVGVCKV